MKQILNTLFIAILAGLVGFFVGQRFPNAFKETFKKVEAVSSKTDPVEEKEVAKTQVDTAKFSRTAVLQINPLGKKTDGLGTPAHSQKLMTRHFFQTQFKIIQSNETIHKAIHDYQLDELWGTDKTVLLKQIKQQLTTAQMRGTDLIEITASANSDEKAQQLAYAITMTYGARRTEDIKARRNEVIKKYDEKIKFQEDKVEGNRAVLMALSKKLKIPYHGIGKPIKQPAIDPNDEVAAEHHTTFGKAKDEYEREFSILQTLKQAELTEVILEDLEVEPLKFHELGWTQDTATMMTARKK